ncbi:hypothetical protein UC34_25330 [Pandoraea vervacti]|uniref:Uncharacterized protein n=1 Tax=Pandoraea vervacti TaxID=656178 RepID=A0ABN4UF57_9BURK|nr:hypothetical protein [Pandoraea vervacti]APD11297.1 hypothetical protein UC34_25330 [Pandoraea vervacti]
MAAPDAAADPAVQLTHWYNSNAQNCGSVNRPAFLCGGVTIRTTDTHPDFYPWDPSPDAIRKGGIAFVWLRYDSNFSKLWQHANGFILYPGMEAPAGTQEVQVLCAFPYDADSWNRPTLNGCGPLTYDPVGTQSCETLGITTAQQWVEHFRKVNRRPYQMCGWNMRIGQQGTADRFYQNILARAQQAPTGTFDWNELLMATWQSGSGATLPIHSFFYLQNVAGALANAQSDQQRYYQAYRKFVPIVRVGMPANAGARATFAYIPAEQVVAPDNGIGNVAPKVLEASANNGARLLISDFYERDTVTVEVPAYPGMAVGQTVGARWQGPSVTYDTPIKSVASVGRMTFDIPRVEVIDAIGATVPVTFSVKRGNNPIEQSAPLNLQIEGQSLSLPAPAIDAAKTQVTVSFPGAASTHNVQVRWAGVVVRDTERQNVVPGRANVFQIPTAWITENAGRTVAVNYAVGTSSGARFQFSRVLRIGF